MEIETLGMLIDVARRGSFAAVARDRGIDPTSVSRPIATLEAELGVRLFQRTTRAMALTEEGEAYVAAIGPLVERLEAAREALARGPDALTGAVRITASTAFGETLLAPLIPAFRAELPALRLELVLTDDNLDLVADRIDIALRLAPSYRADVVGVKLFVTRYHVVASQAYVDREGAPVEPGDLTQRDCIRSAVPEFRSRWLFRAEGRTNEVFVDGHLVSSNAMVLRAAALAGTGPALLADWLIARDLAQGALIDLFPRHDVTATNFETAAWLLYPSRERMPRRIRATIDFLRTRLTI